MCGRYFLNTKDDDFLASLVQAALPAAERFGRKMKTSGDVCPTDLVPVLAPSSLDRRIIPYPMVWGFDHPNRPGVLVFNTRAETAEQKALFCTSTRERRCLIPLSGYYEWAKNESGKKVRYAFTSGERVYLAGLYIRSSGRPFPYFSILTMDAPGPLSAIHHRMPVVVTEQQKEAWISGSLPIAEAPEWATGKDGISFSEKQ